jgi:type VI secretion system secreted protein Hcp
MTTTTILAGIILGTFAIAGLTLGQADAAVDMFLKIDSIPGESQKAGHEDEIDVLSWGWGTSGSGAGGGGGAGKVNVSDLNFVKQMGRASPGIMQKCCDGSNIADVEIILCTSGSAAAEHCYLKITLENAIVTSYSMGAQGEDPVPVEKVTMNFQKIKMDYFPEGAERPEFSGEVEFKANAFVKGKKILEN